MSARIRHPARLVSSHLPSLTKNQENTSERVLLVDPIATIHLHASNSGEKIEAGDVQRMLALIRLALSTAISPTPILVYLSY
jgi:hypothetical protein